MSAHYFIENLKVSPALVLAPMSGVTNSAFRRLIKSENPGDVGLMVTEFISVEGLTRENKNSLKLMDYRPEERPLSIQIFGHDLQRMADAAKMVEATGADIVDINCGCPVPKVVRRGGGCELMRQPEHLEKILQAVKKSVKIPVTLKIRSGWDDNTRNALEIAKMAEGVGVSMLAIHGRTRTQLYRGLADWDIVGEVARSVKIPVVGSGDVVDLDSAKRAFAQGVSGLMIGRGAMLNPWIFSEISAHLSGREYQRPTDLETVRVIEKYADLLMEDLPERAVIGKLKQLVSHVTRRVRGAGIVRKNLCYSKTVEEVRTILDVWRECMINDRRFDEVFNVRSRVDLDTTSPFQASGAM